ncbi:MAG TPA: Hsp20/alpha crystallin family protein [Candidatus Altiarchaeales archaeon]|nr:Hsp20/alpha crystallin family protein [Candidatus Altiarchaeales archaeon]
MDPWKKKRKSFFDPFGDIDDYMNHMTEHINKIMADAVRMSGKEPGRHGPFVYGFNMRVGPDGVPHIDEFGNVKGRVKDFEGGREPLTDVIPSEKEVTVIAELPGIEKKDIDLTVNQNELTIKVDTENRKYFKEIELPAEVEEGEVKANYKNGVLEVKLKKKAPAKPAGRKVQIE